MLMPQPSYFSAQKIPVLTPRERFYTLTQKPLVRGAMHMLGHSSSMALPIFSRPMSTADWHIPPISSWYSSPVPGTVEWGGYY